MGSRSVGCLHRREAQAGYPPCDGVRRDGCWSEHSTQLCTGFWCWGHRHRVRNDKWIKKITRIYTICTMRRWMATLFQSSVHLQTQYDKTEKCRVNIDILYLAFSPTVTVIITILLTHTTTPNQATYKHTNRYKLHEYFFFASLPNSKITRASLL